MRHLLLALAITAIQFHAYAQKQLTPDQQRIADSVREARIDEAALLHPSIRQFSITHQETFSGTINSNLYGNEFFKGDIRMSRTVINMNVPIINKGKNTLTGTMGVVHQFFSIRNITTYDKDYSVSELTKYIPMVNLGASYSRRDSLFGHPISFTASANALVNPSLSSRQFTFLALVAVPIVQKKNTNLMAGLVFMRDPSSPAPAFLFISYHHKFVKQKLDLMVDLPYRIALRKEMFTRASLSAFSEMSGSNSFFEFEDPNPTLPQKMTYSTLDIKSGLLFEYRVTKKGVLSLSGGLNANVKSRVLEQGSKPNDYFIKNTNGSAPFVQVGFSLLPWWHPFTR